MLLLNKEIAQRIQLSGSRTPSYTFFAFGRLQSSLPKALESLFDPPPLPPPDFINIGCLKAFCDTLDEQ
jgi:hypothetical protein